MKSFLILLAVNLAAASVLPLAVPIQPSAVCEQQTLNGDAGTFSSPNFPEDYSSDSECSWLIITGSSTVIELRFDSFLTEPDGDFVMAYDGATTASILLMNHTGFAVPPVVTSKSNVMLVVFKTNSALNYAGFQARFISYLPTTTLPPTTEPPTSNCGGVNIGTGIIQTPNYPAHYPNNSNCIWYLQSNSLTAIALEFQSFITESKLDFVAIYEGWNPAGMDPVEVYSGELSVPFTYATSATNKLTVKFESDDSVSYPGFLAFFS